MWISKEERLPNLDDLDEFGLIFAIGIDKRSHVVTIQTLIKYPSFTHWMPIPHLAK